MILLSGHEGCQHGENQSEEGDGAGDFDEEFLAVAEHRVEVKKLWRDRNRVGEGIDDALGVGDFESDFVGSRLGEGLGDLWAGIVVEESVTVQIPIVLGYRAGGAVGVEDDVGRGGGFFPIRGEARFDRNILHGDCLLVRRLLAITADYGDRGGVDADFLIFVTDFCRVLTLGRAIAEVPVVTNHLTVEIGGGGGVEFHGERDHSGDRCGVHFRLEAGSGDLDRDGGLHLVVL